MVSSRPFYRPRPRYNISECASKSPTQSLIFSSSVHTFYTTAPDMSQSLRCRNCGHDHPELNNALSANCFFITIRRSGRDRLSLSTPHSIPVSTEQNYDSRVRSQQLRDYIWDEFENLKAEVDLDRDTINLQRSPKSKGHLKEKAPIPWLSWTSPNGQSGQTRNKANFFALWDRVMAEARSPRNAGTQVWVSSVLLPARSEAVIWSDELDLDRYADHVHEAGDTLAEKMMLPAVGMSKWDRRPVVVIS